MTHDRFTVVPASYVYLLREGDGGTEVLLQLRRGTGYMDEHWAAAAAGHVERGETAYDAAHREAAEELDVSELDLEFVTSMQRTRYDLPIDERVDFFFTARSWSGEPRIVEPTKCAELRWCALDALPEPVVPHECAVLTAISEGTTTPYSTFGFEEDHPMNDSSMSPKPEPEIEPREPNPGGADAIETEPETIVRDLDPDDNPAVEDALPDEVKQTEDTETVATKGDGSEDVPGEEESPA